jgi:hypothetical protein
MEYWSDGVEGIRKLRPYYPILQHSNTPSFHVDGIGILPLNGP